MSQADLFLVPPPPQAAVPVRGGGLFPVRRIFCVGRNYADHAREMGSDPTREAPFFFTKPADAVLPVAEGSEGVLPYPSLTADLHHEVELVVALGAGGRDLAPEAATACIWGYGVGLDMTRRDLQAAAKDKGRPWDVAKGFDASAPIGELQPMPGRVLAAGTVELTVNGQPRQRGDLNQMIWSVPEIIASLSRAFELKAGDLIFTGTPGGVGAVQRGDLLAARVEGVGSLRLRVA